MLLFQSLLPLGVLISTVTSSSSVDIITYSEEDFQGTEKTQPIPLRQCVALFGAGIQPNYSVKVSPPNHTDLTVTWLFF